MTVLFESGDLVVYALQKREESAKPPDVFGDVQSDSENGTGEEVCHESYDTDYDTNYDTDKVMCCSICIH